MRVVMLTSSFPAHSEDFRGRFVLDMASDWAARGDDVTVVAPHPGQDVPCHDRMGDVVVVRVPCPPFVSSERSIFGGSGVSAELRRAPWLAGLLPGQLLALALVLDKQAAKADLLLSHWLFPMGLIGAWVASRRHIPHGILEHGGGLRAVQRMLPLRPLARQAISTACAVQWVASHQLNWAVQHQMGIRGFVFPMPAPLTFQAPAVQRDFASPIRMLWLGRMVPSKAGCDLVRAMQTAPNVVTTFAGDGPMRDLWEQEARRVAPGRFTFAGEVSPLAVPQLMDRHDVLVFTSAHSESAQEGTPRVLLEAMSRGLIPVAARTGGVVDWVVHQQSGLLFQPGNVGELANLLCGLGASPKECSTLSAKALSSVSRVTWDCLREEWLASLCRQGPERVI